MQTEMSSPVRSRSSWRRLCRVLADEGLEGVGRRVQKSLDRNRAAAWRQVGMRAHEQRVREFQNRAIQLGYGDLSQFYWYHTIDLGEGLITPGDYDYRAALPVYGFPDDMQGMTVLDVGSATGFFAFEFERRGAAVTSVELASIEDWDIPDGPEKERTLADLMEAHRVETLERLTHFHLHAPFRFCQAVLGSKAERCYSRIADLSAEKLGRESFDVVFLGDVLLHTFSPLAGLAAVAPLCRGLLVLAQHLPTVDPGQPLMLFTGNARDRRTWWHANAACLEQMLRRVGFRDVKQVGRHSPAGKGGRWVLSNQTIFHAVK